MHPYDQMLANEWERHVAEEETEMYKIESLDSYGMWTDYLGTGENEFATEPEAWAMVDQLRTLGGDWADAEYRVVAID